ncbi:hypothetical protein, conserved [Eimeria maxima]|uniref:Uncharacterized protein n=1 Tax=Eimeria maxima TaxID=5804 RepID=U6M4J6_EIMMA|nr:hypothetical protein, conserved [Eimeria maxima]CDJ57374.1 hypothetical protein, conserved [Eimeria maxima]
MGVSCIFFMSTGGLVLGIIYCTAGCALGFVPFALYKTQERFWGIVSIISIVSLMLLLIASFGYCVWLLLQTSRAQKEMNSVDGSPLVVPLLGMYAQKAGFVSVRRLQETKVSKGLGVIPLFDGRTMGSRGTSGKQALRALTGAGDEEPVSTTSTSVSSRLLEDSANIEARQTTSGEPIKESANSEAAVQHTESGHVGNSWESTSGEALKMPVSGKTMSALVSTAKKKADKLLVGGDSSFYPAVLRQSWESRQNIFVSKGDLECLIDMNYDSGILPQSEALLRALLDWGLFCGYTRYSIAVLRKWPISCSTDCNFDKLNFSRYRNNAEKTDKQAKEFLEALDSMAPAQAEACTFLATVTTCRISQQNLDSVATTTMCIAIVVSLAIFCAAIKCLADCVKFIKNDNKRMQRLASNPPFRPG